MIDESATGFDSQYTSDVDQLLKHYSKIEVAAMCLPTLSIAPLLWFLWGYIKFVVFIPIDLIILLPLDVIIFIRNLFPGHWSYISLTAPYLKATWTWLRNGEFYVPMVVIGPLTVYLLHWHFRRRLMAVRRGLLQKTVFSEDAASRAFAKIDHAMNVWQPAGISSIILTWVFPAIGPVLELGKAFAPARLPPWTADVALLTLPYILAVLMSAFVVKRGLMLGGTGSDSYYPGFLAGGGGYDVERRLLRQFGVETSEFPIDIVLSVVIYFVGVLSGYNDFQNTVLLSNVKGTPVSEDALWIAISVWAFFGALYFIVYISIWVRRKKVERL